MGVVLHKMSLTQTIKIHEAHNKEFNRNFTKKKKYNMKDELLMVPGYCSIDFLLIEGSHLIQYLNILKLTIMWPSILMLTCSYSQI